MYVAGSGSNHIITQIVHFDTFSDRSQPQFNFFTTNLFHGSYDINNI